jgi:hypothetical protein
MGKEKRKKSTRWIASAKRSKALLSIGYRPAKTIDWRVSMLWFTGSISVNGVLAA